MNFSVAAMLLIGGLSQVYSHGTEVLNIIDIPSNEPNIVRIDTINRSVVSQDNGIDEMSPVVIDDAVMESFNNSLIVDSSADIKKDRTLFNIHVDLVWKRREFGRVIVPYKLDDKFSSTDRTLIETSLNDLENRTGCINFTAHTNEPQFINVTHVESDGCYSLVGQRSGPTKLNLRSDCMNKGSIQHEFIHSLGLSHEHDRPDRDNYVTVNYTNLLSEDPTAKRKEIVKDNFDKDKYGNTLGSPYDYGSVMHYPAWANSINMEKAYSKNKKRTIITKNGESIGQRKKASAIDIKKIKLLYQCERGLIRTWQNMEKAPCSNTCMCKIGEHGCGSNSNACYGNSVCSLNQCIAGSWECSADHNSNVPCCGQPSNEFEYEDHVFSCPEDFPKCIDYKAAISYGSCEAVAPISSSSSNRTQYLIYNSNPFDVTRFYCIELRKSFAMYAPCNFKPAQHWYYDSNDKSGYIRSSIDRNKCIVGIKDGEFYSTKKGATLMVGDCVHDKAAFQWGLYRNGSIRPETNSTVCIRPDYLFGNNIHKLVLDSCAEVYEDPFFLLKSENSHCPTPDTISFPPRTSQELEDKWPPLLDLSFSKAARSTVEDSPRNWHDHNERNCAWYGEDVCNRCSIYGDTHSKFGKVANVACTVCGGGASVENYFDGDKILLGPLDTQGCWDIPDWYDSSGDGCNWYSNDECIAYGQWNCGGTELNANDACCVCGGGQLDPGIILDVPIPGCSNLPFDWFLHFGENGSTVIDCSWYAEKETNCKKFGKTKNHDGINANKACCACGGGLNPSNTGGEECVDSDKLQYKKKKKLSCPFFAKWKGKRITKWCKKKRPWKGIKTKDWCPKTCGNAGVGKCK